MPLILFLIYLLLEVFVSFEVAQIIGAFGFFLEIVFTALLGIAILVNFRLFFSEALLRLKNREISYEAFVSSNIFRILGAFLLVLPGALTDIIGILMQFSTIGFLLIQPFVRQNQNPTPFRESEIIDVEVIEKEKQK
ncbi:MAG: FxsA family protein [Helicobacter sp.]|nr:FxsA family protein [Helicobacter sp.]